MKQKVELKDAICYGMGGAALQLCWYMFSNYLTLFYTDVVALSAGAISAIMLIARIWDGINDPMMGAIADGTRSRWGRFRPYLIFTPPIMAIFSILTFTVFPVHGAAKAIICGVMYIGAGMAYTALSVSLNSIANVVTEDAEQRMKLVTFRSSAMTIVSIILSATAMPLILHFGKSEQPNAKGFQSVTILFSVLMLIGFALCAWRTKEPVVKENKENKKVSFVHSIKVIAKNKYLVLILISTLLGSVATMGRMSMLSYYVIYCMKSYTLIAPMYTIMSITCFVGTLLMPVLSKLFGKRNLLIIYNIIAIICYVVIFFMPTTNVGAIMFITAIVGITNSQQYLLFSIVSDCIDYGTLHSGNTDIGIAMSMLGFSSKLASAIAGSVTVMLLAAVGYVAGQEQTVAVQQGISAVINLFPAVCLVLGLVPLFAYKLTESKMVEIHKELEEKN